MYIYIHDTHQVSQTHIKDNIQANSSILNRDCKQQQIEYSSTHTTEMLWKGGGNPPPPPLPHPCSHVCWSLSLSLFIYVCIHTCIPIYIYIYISISIYIYLHTYIHTYMYIYIHTYIRTCISQPYTWTDVFLSFFLWSYRNVTDCWETHRFCSCREALAGGSLD